MFLLSFLLAQAWAFETEVWVVRHAEKGPPPWDLTSQGHERASQLAQLMGDDVRTVVASQFCRTQQTAEPTAVANEVSITRMNGKSRPQQSCMRSGGSVGELEDSLEEVLGRILENGDGGKHLIVGHSGTGTSSPQSFALGWVRAISQDCHIFENCKKGWPGGPTADSYDHIVRIQVEHDGHQILGTKTYLTNYQNGARIGE